VILAGCVPDLAPYYRQAAIVINPVPYGSGLKIKTVEALAEGKCLVCTEEAIRGLGSPEEVPVVVAGLKQGMSDRIMELLEDATQRRNLERRAWEYAKAHLRGDVVYAPLAHLLAEHAQRGGHDLPGRNRAECDA
jgi:succinoglycan biosynthesis protein ExoO